MRAQRHMDRPIIEHLTDLDKYKLTMGQFVYFLHSLICVVYGFKNRTKAVKLARHIDIGRLREELQHLRTLRYTDRELQYLGSQMRSTGKSLFEPEYLRFLKDEFRMPEFHVAQTPDDDITTTFGEETTWPHSIMGETLELSIKNELYTMDLTKHLTDGEYDRLLNDARKRRQAIIDVLKRNPKVRFMEFGTRRRFSRDWQYETVEDLVTQIPDQITGTSNVYLAMILGILSKGTVAHELFMVLAAIASILGDEALRASHNQVLQQWAKFYGPDLLIALTDTFGSDFFFRDMTSEQAHEWKGLRQDSGDAIEFGEKQLLFYKQHGVDPLQKLLVPSDGLDVDTLVKITNHFLGKIPVEGGWGTGLTFDIPGIKPLSIVVKAISANGIGTVKLSDNIAKAMGRPEDIERYKRVFEYGLVNNYTECRV